MKESKLSKSYLSKWQEKNPGGRLFRNNTGVGWAGVLEIINKAITGLTVRLSNARIIKFGIGIKNKKGNPVGGGDYIGWTEKTICEIMNKQHDCLHYTSKCQYQVCEYRKKIAIFTNLEFKTKNIKESPEQIKFRKMVESAGGISEVIREE